MKIFAAGLAQENNTFSPIPSGLDDFFIVRSSDIELGKAVFEEIEPFGVWQLNSLADGHQFIFSMSADSTPSGVIVRSVYESLRDEILGDLENAGAVEIVLLSLHGAMVAEGYDDCDGDIIHRVRNCVGKNVIIAVELDLHCHMSDKMLAQADIIITYKEYPHVDVSARAQELYDLAIAAAESRIQPTMAVFDCKMMGMYPTTGSALRQFVDHLSHLETQEGVLSASFIHSFPWGDVEDAGSKMLVITDNDPILAAHLARELGLQLFSLRHEISFDTLPMERALSLALSKTQGPVVVADQSDNPGGGAPGDSTYVLGWLLAHHVTDAAMGIFYDPQVVKLALAVGEGAQLMVRLGGKMGRASGDPIDMNVRVGRTRKDYIHLWPQQTGEPIKWPCGDVVALHCNGIDLVVSSERCQCFSPTIFADLGIDATKKRLLILKSTQHFYGEFAPIAADIIYMAAPGAIAPIIQDIAYTKMNISDKYPWTDNPHD